MAFSHEVNLGDEYSEDLAAQFCNAYQMRDGECLKPSEGWRRHVVFGLKVLGDFALMDLNHRNLIRGIRLALRGDSS